MAQEQKWDRNNKGPTDKSIRTFHDTFNEETRYDSKEKRRRRLEKEKLKKIKDLDPDELEDY